MKQLLRKMKESGLFVMIILFLCSVFGVVDAGAMTADVINPAGGGAVDTDAAVSATETRVNSEDLLLDTIDEKVAKIRPYDVALDTIAFRTSSQVYVIGIKFEDITIIAFSPFRLSIPGLFYQGCHDF
jgi:hypothetical protein